MISRIAAADCSDQQDRERVMRVSDPLARRLQAIVGAKHVLVDPDLTASFETDWTRRWIGRARLVVRPADTEQTSGVVSVCADAGIPIVPQGGNTGLVGGGVPRDGEVVLSLTRLRELGPVDQDSLQVTVGAGVPLSQLQEHVRASNCEFGIDLAARDAATVGGMVATNAGGVHVIKHGRMRSQVLGVEVVLADGRVISRMTNVRDEAGYDLPGLVIGSEGTLALITAVRLQLIPPEPYRAVALIQVPGAQGAVRLSRFLRSSLPSLSACELIDETGVQLVARRAGEGSPFLSSAAAYVLAECSATEDPVDSLISVFADTSDVLDSAVATDAPGRFRLWRYREDLPNAISSIGIPHKWDVSVPLAALPEFLSEARQLVSSMRPQAGIITFGHLGEGNLHLNAVGLANDDREIDEAILRLVVARGGSISGEHGIGVAKRRWLSLIRSSPDLETMYAIKRALDPAGLLNPGVLIEVPRKRPRQA